LVISFRILSKTVTRCASEWRTTMTTDIMPSSRFWMRTKEAAAHAGVCSETIRRAVRKHELPSGRIRTQIRLRVEDVDDWLRRGGAAVR
jgi:excisionase family DNA binding protein